MTTGLSGLRLETFSKLNNLGITRGHSLKLLKQQSTSEMRQHFFSNRVVTSWKRLDDCIVTAQSLSTFKVGLSKLKKKRMNLFRDWCPLGPGGGYWLTALTKSCCCHRLKPQPGEWVTWIVLAKFFSDKIHKFHTSILTNRISASPHIPPPFTQTIFSSFPCFPTDKVSKLLSQSPDTICDLDPISTPLMKQCSHILLPTTANMINMSIFSGISTDQFKNCSVHPHLKKSNLDKDDLGKYHPIYYLSFLSKLTETVVKLRLLDYLFLLIYQQHSKYFPVCLYQISLYWKYSPLRSWSHHQSYVWVINKSLVSHFLTYLLLLTL